MSTSTQNERLKTEDHPIILFDGVCHLCQGSVKFILKRDRAGRFRFASLQSELGQSLLDQYELPKDLSTIVLVENEGTTLRSTAALRIASQLGWPWRAMGLFLVVPRFLRDPVYRFIAHYRYRWFGKDETCALPEPGWAERILDT